MIEYLTTIILNILFFLLKIYIFASDCVMIYKTSENVPAIAKEENIVMNEQQINEASEKLIKKLRRELAFTRIMCLVTSLLILALLAGGGYVLRQVNGIMGQMQPVLDQAAVVDVENVNDTLRQVKRSLEDVDLAQVAEMMEQAVETLEEVDIEALNEAISGLDTQELSRTMANLNDAVESLKRVESSLNRIFGKRSV